MSPRAGGGIHCLGSDGRGEREVVEREEVETDVTFDSKHGPVDLLLVKLAWRGHILFWC